MQFLLLYLLHPFHNRFIFRRLHVQQKKGSFFWNYNAAGIEISVVLSAVTSVILVHTDCQFSKPPYQRCLVYLRIFLQIVKQNCSLYTVHTLSAVCAMFDKFQNFIHFFHMHFSSAVQFGRRRSPSTPASASIHPFSNETHQKLMIKIFESDQSDLSSSIILDARQKCKHYLGFYFQPERTYHSSIVRRRSSAAAITLSIS